MFAHGAAGRFGFALFDRHQDSFVMVLAALGPAFHFKNTASLLTQQSNNRVQQRKDEGISRRLRQRQMKIQVGFNVGFTILQITLHDGKHLPHRPQ